MIRFILDMCLDGMRRDALGLWLIVWAWISLPAVVLHRCVVEAVEELRRAHANVP